MLPENSLAIASLVLSLYFLQGVFFFLFFYYKVSQKFSKDGKQYLYFAGLSAAQALYSFGGCQIYASKVIEHVIFWQKVQWFAGIILFVYFVLFSVDYLHLKIQKIKWVLIGPAIFFALSALVYPHFLVDPVTLRKFQFFGIHYAIYEKGMGSLAQIASAWIALFMLLLLLAWFLFLTQRREKLRAASLGIVFPIVTSLNELWVGLGFYSSPYLMEYGFFLFSVSFYIQLFSDFFELYHENIRQSQKLERKNEESKFFINTVAHDLQAPLISIEGFSSLLESENLSAHSNDYLQRIRRNVSHMMKMLQDLKSFISIGELQDQKQRFDLKSCVREVLASFELRLKSFEIQCEVAPDLEVCFCKRRLIDVLTNLIDNAIKYAGENQTPYLRLSATRKGHKIEFLVEDNGSGIDEKYHEEIFTPFRQLSRDKGGIGLGLASIKKKLEVSGEKIWIENVLPKGARFIFTLPAL